MVIGMNFELLVKSQNNNKMKKLFLVTAFLLSIFNSQIHAQNIETTVEIIKTSKILSNHIT